MTKPSYLLKNNLIWTIALLIATLMLGIGIFSAIVKPSVDRSFSGKDMEYHDADRLFSTPAGIDLSAGLYTVTVDYHSTEDLHTNLSCDSDAHNPVYSDDPSLKSNLDRMTYDIWLNDRCENVILWVGGVDSDFEICGIRLRTAWNSSIYDIVRYILLYLMVIIVLLAIYNRGRLSKHSPEILTIILAAILPSLGLFVRYIIPGHDLNFHLMRIEGIKEAIMLGDIPVKVQTNWCSGWGYAVSAAYGDITLIFPALLRLAGFTVQCSYKAYVLLVNILTPFVAWLCFQKMCKDQKAVMLMTFLYSMAPYRLVCIYNRAAVGEYTGMVFLPMIALGFYRAYMEDTDSEEYGKKLLVPALGFTLLVQTHLLTCVMLSIFIFIFCIIMWKKTFTKKVFVYLLKIALAALVLSLWFLIPVIRFLQEPLVVTIKDSYEKGLQYYGLSLPEIFAQKSSGNLTYNFAFLTSLRDRLSMPLGNAFVVMMIGYLYLSAVGTIKKNKAPVYILMGLGVFATFLASNLFPYSFLHERVKFICDYLIKVQFPYRYITMSILFFTLMIGFAFPQIRKKASKRFVLFITIITLLICADQSMEIVYGSLYNGYYDVCYDQISLDDNQLIGGEYVYSGTDISVPLNSHDVYGENAVISSWSNIKNRYDITIASSAEGASIQIPLYYYPGYKAFTDDGKSLKLERGDNNRIKVILPDGFSGSIKVRYKEFLIWRICEIISLLGFAALIIFEVRGRNNDEYATNEIRALY